MRVLGRNHTLKDGVFSLTDCDIAEIRYEFDNPGSCKQGIQLIRPIILAWLKCNPCQHHFFADLPTNELTFHGDSSRRPIGSRLTNILARILVH